MAHSLIRQFTPLLIKRGLRTSSAHTTSPSNSDDKILHNLTEPIHLERNATIFHHFNTHLIVQELENQGFSRPQSVVIMKGIKFKLRESLSELNQAMLHKSDLENETYLFKAAISELRAEIQAMRQKDTQQLKQDTMLLTREVDGLTQQIQEEIDTMKNEITLSMNNQKNETRSDHKEIDLTIQELNSKLTVQLGEVRTALESTRWETIWKGLVGVAGTTVAIATVAYFLTHYAEKRAQEQRAEKQKRKKQMQEEARHAGLVDMEVVY